MKELRIDLDKIDARLREIDALRASLAEEAEELQTVKRIAVKYGNASAEIAVPADTSEEPRLGPPRPKGIPTLFHMTYEVLREAEGQGKSGLSGAEIVAAIGERYWPGLRNQQVMPSVYGFVKDGRLGKMQDGTFYTVRKDEAPPGNPEGASQDTGGVATP
ncbi:MAG: hypothetical protein E5X88_33195 [Mesorhizobium sp.]|uniref:hypothetical protein n=1 Tax=Mesorhizobium sp. TaxID=1871066 RepID=UPI00121D6637|nr:hypothetical protein [Mesorhizobium sp.]TIO04125.1 MAG: hypothetical protein E5X88_33195 [Mesorhizobium sp.]